MTQSPPALSGGIILLGEVAATALVAWVALLGTLWSRYRREDQSPWRFLYQSWIVFDGRLFRPEGARLLLLVRITFVAVVVPLVVIFLWLAPA